MRVARWRWACPGPRIGARRGSTLVELLVALTILSIGMAATTGMLTLASRGMRHAEMGLRGALVASEVLGRGEAGEGSRTTGLGSFEWRAVPSGGIELRFEPPDGGTGGREWRVVPAGTAGEARPWWSS